MLWTFAKRTAAHLPHDWQQALKRRHFQREIQRDAFRTNEPEWERCAQWLSPGDWAIDVGANIGHYTKRFSDLVGAAGRVLAFEPVPATFELLAANAAQFAHANVTLLNLAASDESRLLGISIPQFDTGLKNYYGAALTEQATGLQVMTCPIDALGLPGRVRVVKVDAEGHDAVVLRGARQLLARERPVVVIETAAPEVDDMMRELGYVREVIPGSSNVIFRPPAR
ncbi:MAG: FkbM family methyltransferase [Piscinibacter sp.]|uniref:FkbM family methyltransferase n=1 Tax=Piscinibacter sp. TaxID=1903157 RepID=UPI002590D117|nr:FkbM family methyltransferase [Piscinibacter sp.]MCW5662476.1 FkbM family methyltransferase [Piscinibacter sp.]